MGWGCGFGGVVSFTRYGEFSVGHDAKISCRCDMAWSWELHCNAGASFIAQDKKLMTWVSLSASGTVGWVR